MNFQRSYDDIVDVIVVVCSINYLIFLFERSKSAKIRVNPFANDCKNFNMILNKHFKNENINIQHSYDNIINVIVAVGSIT